MKTIKVTQNARGKFAPDTAVIAFSPTAESKSASEAAAKLSREAEKIKTALCSKMQFAEGEITESGKNVSALRRDGKTVFTASSRIKIVLKADDVRIGAAVECAESCGSQWRTEYMLTDKTHCDKLVADAVNKAKQTAQSIAAAAGVKLGALSSVEYAAPFGGEARVMRAMASDGGAAVTPEPIEAVETVTCEWEIV